MNYLKLSRRIKMTDLFMHYHQAALDSQREEAAINWRFPEPDNDDILERLFEEAYDEIKENNILQLNEDDLIFAAKTRAERRFDELPEPGDYDD